MGIEVLYDCVYSVSLALALGDETIMVITCNHGCALFGATTSSALTRETNKQDVCSNAQGCRQHRPFVDARPGLLWSQEKKKGESCDN